MTDEMPDLSAKILTKIHDELRGLRGIHDELRGLRNDVQVTNERLGSLETKVEVTNARLGIIEHTLVDFGTQVVFAGRLIKNVEQRHDREIDELRTRITKLESKPSRR